MTGSPDRTAELLVRVAEFLRKLPLEQVEALAAGQARLEVVPKGARITTSVPKAKAALTIAPDRVEADLKSIGDRQAAAQYIKDLNLKKAELFELALAMNVAVIKSATIPVIVGKIVEQKVGHRLDTEAIMRG